MPAQDMINLVGLREELQRPIYSLATRVVEDLGENLRSLCVVGSALTPDFHETRSDIDTVLVVGRRSHALLQRLARYAARMERARLAPPLLMTPEYIAQSLDVFAVGLLDFQFNHHVVLGTDPFEGLAFDREDVRLECEKELKGTLMDLRHDYIRAAGNLKQVGRMLTRCVGNLLPLMRAMLWLKDAERSPEAARTIHAAAQWFAFNSTALETPLRLREDRRQPATDQVDVMFENIYRVVDHLSRTVDTMVVGE